MKVTLNKELKMKAILNKELKHTSSITNRRVSYRNLNLASGEALGNWNRFSNMF